ncbi:hypothetical protein MUDAN_IGPPGNFN_03651 [Lactiplantibacillus mudanjiangensis]|nr:hypothetical protein MUDAN_IGPPGNFN_03651 [Lactiplantibacillus mudanjiangensis]
MLRRQPRSTLSSSSAASDVYKRQIDDETLQIKDEHIDTAIHDILDVNELDYEEILESAKIGKC